MDAIAEDGPAQFVLNQPATLQCFTTTSATIGSFQAATAGLPLRLVETTLTTELS